MEPATIGLIGVLVGALLGALLNFFRERSADKRRWLHEKEVQDNQWEREKQDQQQQWQREDEVGQQQWEHENQLRNHEQRLRAYTELLALGTAGAGDLGHGLQRASTTEVEKREKAIETVETDNATAAYLVSSIRLLAPEDVYEAAEEFATAASAVRIKRGIEYGEALGIAWELEGYWEDVKNTSERDLMRTLVKARIRFLKVVQEEPGFEN